MARFLGSDSTVEISSDGSSYTAVGECISYSLSVSNDMVEITTNDDSGKKKYLPADQDATFSVTYVVDHSDTGQDNARSYALTKALTYFRVRPEGSGSGKPEYTFSGYITSVNVDASHAERVEQSVEVQVDGGITEAAQA